MIIYSECFLASVNISLGEQRRNFSTIYHSWKLFNSMNVKGVDYTKLYEIIVLFKYSSITVFVVIEFVINSRFKFYLPTRPW